MSPKQKAQIAAQLERVAAARKAEPARQIACTQLVRVKQAGRVNKVGAKACARAMLARVVPFDRSAKRYGERHAVWSAR